MATDIEGFFSELGGGVDQEIMSSMLSAIASAVDNTTKSGTVAFKFDIKPIGSGGQVNVTFKQTYVKPTKRGRVLEERTSETPMYVGAGGKLSIFPENQSDMFTQQRQAAIRAKNEDQPNG